MCFSRETLPRESFLPGCIFYLSDRARHGCGVRVLCSSAAALRSVTDAWHHPCPRRLVLSSVSDYFAAMFTSDVREAKQDEVKMEGVDPDALWVLVQYAYTGMDKYWPVFIDIWIFTVAVLQLPTSKVCLFIQRVCTCFCSRPPGVKGGHHWVPPVGVLPATVVVCGSGVLFFPHEAAPPF